MVIRRILASFLLLLFVLVSIPNFFIYALSRTFLDTEFYKRDDLRTGIYDFAVDKTVVVLQENSEMMRGYFKPEELKKKIEQVFTKKTFGEILDDFAVQLEKYKQTPDAKLVLSLRVLRENLLTVSNNLVYQIYQSLPTCSEDMDLVNLSLEKAPSCVPKNISYELVVKPITSNFESTIYNNVPEEMANIDKVVPMQLLIRAESYRNMSFLILIIILMLIVLVVFSSTTVIVSFIGTGFLLSGVVGYVIGSSFILGLDQLKERLTDVRAQEFLLFLLNFVADEVKRLSVLFFLVGVALFVVKFVLKRTVDQKNNTV